MSTEVARNVFCAMFIKSGLQDFLFSCATKQFKADSFKCNRAKGAYLRFYFGCRQLVLCSSTAVLVILPVPIIILIITIIIMSTFLTRNLNSPQTRRTAKYTILVP